MHRSATTGLRSNDSIVQKDVDLILGVARQIAATEPAFLRGAALHTLELFGQEPFSTSG
jgi:hypothetical protein